MREETTRDELIQRQEKLIRMKADYEQRLLAAQKRHAEKEMEQEEVGAGVKLRGCSVFWGQTERVLGVLGST